MRVLCLMALAAFLVAPSLADWPHQVKWDQLQPDSSGYGGASWVNVTDPGGITTSADDFPCTGSPADRFITDIEFYGFSSYGSTYINTFRIGFWTDIPADANETSRPGTKLYSYDVPPADPNDPLKIGWQELESYHFKIDLPQNQWFDQGLTPRTLWISIQGVMADDGYADYFYWYFRDRNLHFADDAAFDGGTAFPSYPAWWHWALDTSAAYNLYDNLLPAGWVSTDMCFRLTGVPEPATIGLLLVGLVLLRRR